MSLYIFYCGDEGPPLRPDGVGLVPGTEADGAAGDEAPREQTCVCCPADSHSKVYRIKKYVYELYFCQHLIYELVTHSPTVLLNPK